jgi:hypothetical protein
LSIFTLTDYRTSGQEEAPCSQDREKEGSRKVDFVPRGPCGGDIRADRGAEQLAPEPAVVHSRLARCAACMDIPDATLGKLILVSTSALFTLIVFWVNTYPFIDEGTTLLLFYFSCTYSTKWGWYNMALLFIIPHILLFSRNS